MPPKQTVKVGKGVKRAAVEEDSESENEYRQKRERNNIAVKKSREKSRARTRMTASRVEELQRENTELEGKIKGLSQQLDLLKNLLVLRAGKKTKTNDEVEDADVSRLSVAESSQTVTADPALIEQDHGYVSQLKRTPRKPR